jgi:4-hydroxy-tetrahydrodipicolinate reductase
MSLRVSPRPKVFSVPSVFQSKLLNTMKIAIVGYGKMGRLIEELAPASGVEIGGRFDIGQPLMPGDFRVAVDFTMPEAIVDNVRRAAELGVNVVIGTTGWYDHLPTVRDIVESSGIGVVYGANFSIGVNLFFRIVKQAAELAAAHPEYDPYIWEMHHRHKKDAPSGTAVVLQRLLREAYGRDIAAASVRAGEIPGTHEVGFDSEADTITLTHTARGRKGFALGALLAAKWIESRKGLHEFQEVL